MCRFIAKPLLLSAGFLMRDALQVDAAGRRAPSTRVAEYAAEVTGKEGALLGVQASESAVAAEPTGGSP